MPTIKSKQSEDLRTTPAQGRLDVLAYNLGKKYAETLESTHNLHGLWNVIEPHVQTVIKKGLGGLEVPSEAMIMLGIFQAGMINSIPPNIPDASGNGTKK